MLANRGSETSPELAVRKELFARGHRYRVRYTVRYDATWTRPDIVFTRRRVAVYIDGCFWHSCPRHGTSPQTNARYWKPKLMTNRLRDQRASSALRRDGWCVLRFWEHQDPALVCDIIGLVLTNRTGRSW